MIVVRKLLYFFVISILCAIPLFSQDIEQSSTLLTGSLRNKEVISVTESIEKLLTPLEYEPVTYESYRIKKGDMIGIIAEKFGVTQDTLISVNSIRQTRLIQIGEYLKIPSMPGIVYTVKKTGETPQIIAEQYDVDAEKTAGINGYALNTSLTAGNQIFVPDAELDWVTIQEINGDLFSIPIRAWYYISSGYGWRNSPVSGNRTFHAAVDMASPAWTKVYCSLIGTVSRVVRNDYVYGNYVVIKHHSGYTTLYAHLIDINVRVGQSVGTDSVIGWVGSTGLSTGNHLHFAVSKYGVAVDPELLWH